MKLKELITKLPEKKWLFLISKLSFFSIFLIYFLITISYYRGLFEKLSDVVNIKSITLKFVIIGFYLLALLYLSNLFYRFRHKIFYLSLASYTLLAIILPLLGNFISLLRIFSFGYFFVWPYPMELSLAPLVEPATIFSFIVVHAIGLVVVYATTSFIQRFNYKKNYDRWKYISLIAWTVPLIALEFIAISITTILGFPFGE